jgi:hypothetical protein
MRDNGDMIVLQPASRVDNLTSDGTELCQRPFPFLVDGLGLVQRQDFWSAVGVYRVVGFQRDLAVQRLDVSWFEVNHVLVKAVGLYVVTADAKGNYGVHDTAIESFEVVKAVRHGEAQAS